MMIEGILFDVDGVLVDSPHERAWRETLQELMASVFQDVRSSSRYSPERFDTALYLERVAGKPREDGAAAVLEYFGIPDPDGQRAAIYGARKQEKIAALIRAGAFEAFPDALRFVLALQRLGLHLAAASSSRNANDLLARIPLGDPPAPLIDAFDANVCGRKIPLGKPHPDIFLAAAAELGVRPSLCLVVEDATAGILAAKAGGMRALGVARLGDAAFLWSAGADLVVRSLDDVDAAAIARGELEARAAAA